MSGGRCLSCGAQCLETVSHDGDGSPHRPEQLLCTFSSKCAPAHIARARARTHTHTLL